MNRKGAFRDGGAPLVGSPAVVIATKRKHVFGRVNIALVVVTAAASFMAISVAPAAAITPHKWVQYSDGTGLISYMLPSTWSVVSEHSLVKIGFLSAPYPSYVVIAGAEPAELDHTQSVPIVQAK